MADDPLAERLARIDTRIADRRAAYMRAVCACHDGEAEILEREVDRLLWLRYRVQTRAWPASA